MRAFVNRSYKEERRKQKACGREGHAPLRPSGVQTPPESEKAPEGANGRAARVRRWGGAEPSPDSVTARGAPVAREGECPRKAKKGPEGPHDAGNALRERDVLASRGLAPQYSRRWRA